MGTRSVVAAPAGDDFKGRYIHWDGYPAGVGESLLAIVQRDGVERALQVLTVERYGWSNLNAEQSEGDSLGRGMDDGRFMVVPGYGVAYTTYQNQSEPENWITSFGDDWGTEWAYVLTKSDLLVLQRRWGTPEADEGEMVGMFGCGADAGKGYWLTFGRVPYTHTKGSVADLDADKVG